MDEQSGQLTSTRINQLAGESAGHTNETAHNEVTFDNPTDVGSTETCLLKSDTNLCFAILDNGPGIPNIWHLFGEGEGLKIKTGGKIGNKIAGELAAGTFFQADRTLYFSRCNENNVGRKHEQLNVEYNKIVKLVKTPNMDMTIANNNIRQGPNRLVRKPEPDSDKFDSDNVQYVKELFKNNEYIMRYFDDKTVTGMLKVFTYEEENKARFEKMISEMPKILSKAEFITYNTLNGFSGDKVFKHIDVDRDTIRTINQESCKKNFILGRDAVVYEDDEDYDEHSCIVDETFGLMSEKVLSMTNYFYEKDGKTYNRCSIDNYDEDFLITADGKATQINKVTDKNITDIISNDENIVGHIPMYLSFVSKDEAEEQTVLMNESSTLESMKQAYVYYHGRYLARDKLINILAGFQERSLPHFRFAIGINDETTQYINIRAQKSSISLSKAHPLIPKTIQEIIKPIICKLYEKDSNMIKDGIDNWDDFKNDVLSLINTGKLVPKPIPLATPAPTPAPAPAPPKPIPTPNPVPPPGERGPAPVVFASLDYLQSIVHLKKLKNTMNLGQKYRTKNDKSKIITILNNIERELVLDDDMMDEKIDNLITLLLEAGKKPGQAVKHAASLQGL
jgi:hypothetical protein